jgi:hypothetical protein
MVPGDWVKSERVTRSNAQKKDSSRNARLVAYRPATAELLLREPIDPKRTAGRAFAPGETPDAVNAGSSLQWSRTSSSDLVHFWFVARTAVR